MALGNFTSWFDQPLTSQYYNEDHEAWRYALRQFIDKEVAPMSMSGKRRAPFLASCIKKPRM